MDRLNGLDASFLYLEKPNVHMHIAGLAIFDSATAPDGEVSFQDVAELLRRRVHEVPRFRQKIHFVPLDIGRPVWAICVARPFRLPAAPANLRISYSVSARLRWTDPNRCGRCT